MNKKILISLIIITIVVIALDFYVIKYLLGPFGALPKGIPPKNIPGNNSELTPEELITKYASCEVDSDCGLVQDPNDFCCGSTYSMNTAGIKEYNDLFAEEFKKKNEMCDKEYKKGLSCALEWYEPVCVDNTCKLKDKMRGDEIIENEFISNPFFPH